MNIRISSMAAMMIFMAVMAASMIAPDTAGAQMQNPNCCTYSIEIIGIDATCFPVRIKTEWDGFVVDEPVYWANGIFVRGIPGPCPPARKFRWASVDLGGTQVRLFESKKVTIGGCCYEVKVELNPNSCIHIRISKC